jgi:hypothetical protein
MGAVGRELAHQCSRISRLLSGHINRGDNRSRGLTSTIYALFGYRLTLAVT